MHISRGTGSVPLHVAARVRTLMRQTVTLLKNNAACDAGDEAFAESIDMLFAGLRAFLNEHEALTLRIRKKEINFGDQVVYVPIGRSDALVFPLYRDGIRRLTFSKDLTRDELAAFLATLVAGRDTDAYESDLVTALWERDLANITYDAEDNYLERGESEGIENIAERVSEARENPGPQPGTEPADFLIDELALASGAGASLKREIEALIEDDIEKFRSQVMEEDDSTLLERCSSVCLEILESTAREEVFRKTASFLGELCDWLVSEREFLPVCSVISDLRAIAGRPGLPETAAGIISGVITERGGGCKISEIRAYVEDLDDAKLEELFCYLGQMDPVAVQPLCHILAEAQTRRVRYMLARAISIVAKDSVETLLPFLRDSRWYVTRNVAMILGMIGTEETLTYLDEASRHPEARVRREVTRSLGRIGKAGGLNTLKLLMQDENKMIRLAAASAAGHIGGDKARALLEDAILDERFETRAIDEKRRFMEIYGELTDGDVAFLEALIGGRRGKASETTRACAAYGLAAAGGDEARRALKAIATGAEGTLRYAAAEAAAMIGDRINGSSAN